MERTDEQLLDFDTTDLANWNLQAATAALAGEHGSLYRNHLAVAEWIASWSQNLRDGEFLENPSEFNEGFTRALAEVAAHLRQADLLPGGVLLGE